MVESHETEEAMSVRGWAIVILVAALVALWGLLNFAVVKDLPRTWHFGVLPDAPSESVYSTEEAPQSLTPPRQTPMLPEAQPKKPAGGAP
jgi:hypothetical protein